MIDDDTVYNYISHWLFLIVAVECWLHCWKHLRRVGKEQSFGTSIRRDVIANG